MRRLTALAVVLAVSAAVAMVPVAAHGAANDDPQSVAFDYFDHLFSSGSPGEAARAVELAAKDSPAYAYAVHQQILAEAQVATGGTYPNTVKRKGENISLCEANTKTDCTIVGKFKLNKKGRLRTFSYIDGRDTQLLTPPLLGTGQVGTAAGVTFTLVSSFQARDALFVTFRVTGDPGAERSIYSYESTYTPPGAPSVQAATTLGVSSTIQAGVAGVLALVFPGVLAPDGTVTIPVNTGPPDYVDANAVISLAAP